MLNVILTTIIAFLIGSIPFAYGFSKYILKKNITEIGSGNQGATNVYRAGGIIPATLVFLMDFLKGFMALFIYNSFSGNSDFLIILPAIAVVLGHIFPVFTKFKGGKGVSTSAGVFFYISPLLFIISFSIFWITYFITHLVSLSSIVAVNSLIIIAICLYLLNYCTITLPILSILITLILLISHRENLKRLKNGNEEKI